MTVEPNLKISTFSVYCRFSSNLVELKWGRGFPLGVKLHESVSYVTSQRFQHLPVTFHDLNDGWHCEVLSMRRSEWPLLRAVCPRQWLQPGAVVAEEQTGLCGNFRPRCSDMVTPQYWPLREFIRGFVIHCSHMTLIMGLRLEVTLI